MAHLPPSDPKKRRQEENLDHLVREAMSESSLMTNNPRPQAVARFELETERLRSRRLYVTLACVVVAAALGCGAWIWHVHSQRVREQDEQAQLAQRGREATEQVGSLVADQKFDEAMSALEGFVSRGLPPDTNTDLQHKIEDGRLAHQTKLLEEAEVAREHKDYALARQRISDLLAAHPAASLQSRIQRLNGDLSVAPSQELMEQARQARKRQAWEEARGLVERAAAMPSDLTEIRRFQTSLADEATKALLGSVNQAADKEDWETALKARERLESFAHGDTGWTTIEGDLRKRIGGLVRVDAEPPTAMVTVGEHEPVASGTTVAGLPDGDVDIKVNADGYLPEELTEKVQYPKFVTKQVSLIRASSSAVWAVFALEGKCAQGLAAEFYHRKSDPKSFPQDANRLVHACAKAPAGKPAQYLKLKDGSVVVGRTLPTPSGGRKVTLLDGKKRDVASDDIEEERLATEKEEANALLPIEEQKFNDSSGDRMAALEKLAQFTSAHPGTIDQVLEVCGSKIHDCLSVAEGCCGECRGTARTTCEKCQGKGKHKEMRICSGCSGQGHKVCVTCNGNWRMLKCSKCDGKGFKEIKTAIADPTNRTPTARSHTRREPCTACQTQGHIMCTKCQQGQLPCTLCHASGQHEQDGVCSACSGSGGPPCAACAGAGLRDKMDPASRRKVEEAIAAAMAP